MNNNSAEMLEDLTIEDFAQRIKRHPETVRRMVRAGRLPCAYKIGRKWLINREKFEAIRQGEVCLDA